MGPTNEITLLEIVLIGMLGMFLLSLAVVSFFIVYQRRLLRQQEQNQKMQEEHQQKLLRASVESQEKERHRIAESLHDEIGALLTTTKLHLGQIKPNADAATLKERVDTSVSIIGETLQSVRQISHDLKPPVLETLGLLAAIRSLISKANVSDETAITCEGPDELVIPADESLGLYRIVQELLQNALKHAQASNVHFAIRQSGKSVIIHYTDDGVGMKETAMTAGGGLGLRNIESRLNLMEGSIEILNQTPGTHLKIKTHSKHEHED